MPWTYHAEYGYRYGSGNLNGADPSTDLTVTDSLAINGRVIWYTIIENNSGRIPVRDTTLRSTKDAADIIRLVLPEYTYVTLIPQRLWNTIYNEHIAGDSEIYYYTNMFPYAYYNCPNLAAEMSDITDTTNRTGYVHLLGPDVWIDSYGYIYHKNPSTGKLQSQTKQTGPYIFGSFSTSYSGPIDNSSGNIQLAFNGPDYGYIVTVRCGNYEWPREQGGGRGAYEVYASVERHDSTLFELNLKDLLDYANHPPDEEPEPEPEDDDPYIPPNPYDPDKPKPSKPGGGDGEKKIPKPVPTPDEPQLPSFINSGFVHVYSLTDTELNSLALELWNLDDSDLKKMSKLVVNPMDAILSLHYLPVSVTEGTSQSMRIGGYTAVSTAKPVLHQYIHTNCGQIQIPKIWGAYLDYKARIDLFLPFIGMIQLDPDDVIGETIQVKYTIDVLTGTCVAYVQKFIEGAELVLLATYAGNCAQMQPVTGSDHSRIIGAIIGAVAGAASAIATGGMSAPMAAGTMASSSLNVATSKIQIQKVGGLTANAAFMGIRTPYLMIHIPNQCIPENQNSFIGYPSFITERIGDLSGYTEIYKVHLSGIPATDEEINEIRTLLEGGVML